jgi:hypothetical protein
MRSTILAVLAVTSVAASACGGGDKGPTGPGGGDDGIAGEYQLVNLGGRVSLPIDLAIESCQMMRFLGGGLRLSADGTWQMVIALQDGNGPQRLEDEGSFQQDGADLWFESADYGDSFGGTVNGTVVTMDYDYCPNGESDIQFWFQR